MQKKPPLGSGQRFASLAKKLESTKGDRANDAKALAAYIGRKKHGSKKFGQLSQKGKKDN
jgi:hypothetical protein